MPEKECLEREEEQNLGIQGAEEERCALRERETMSTNKCCCEQNQVQTQKT